MYNSTRNVPSRTQRIRKFAYNYATKLVLPQTRRQLDEVDKEYEEKFNCWPPPITIFLVTLVEILVFIYYAVEFGYVSVSGPVPFDSVLIYNPHKRHEIWRYCTYALLHFGLCHIIINIFFLLLLGIPLELVHKWWRVWLIYISGVLAGSLGTSIADPKVYLGGASGGVYALVSAHLAVVIMNFNEMEYAIYQLCILLAMIIFDSSLSIYNRFWSVGSTNKIGCAAHLAGTFAGLLIGILVLKDVVKGEWKKPLWWISLFSCIILLLSAIIWNIVLTDYFS